MFLGVSIPEDVKKRLFRVVEREYRHVPVRWTAKENYHLTLNFFGYVQEEKIPEVCDQIRKAAVDREPFEINFIKIEAGPSEKSKRLVWATGEKNADLTKLKESLDEKLEIFGRERKGFTPHITLGRIKKNQWRRGESEPDIVLRPIKFLIPVQSVELYESRFEKGKRIYFLLESFPLK